jgi:hypothetical protein
MQSILLKKKLTINFQPFSFSRLIMKNKIKQLLLGFRSIYTEQTMQALVFVLLLSTPKLMVSLL